VLAPAGSARAVHLPGELKGPPYVLDRAGATYVLAADVTARVHGEEAATRVVEASRILFGELDPRAAAAETWHVLARELPSAPVDLETDKNAVELATMAGLCKSKGEARRLLAQRGIYLNGQPLPDDATIGREDLLPGGFLWMRRGKKTDTLLFTRGP